MIFLKASILLLQLVLCKGLDALPTSVVALSQTEGQKLLLNARYKDDFFILIQHFIQTPYSQPTDTNSGVASSVMLLNALETPRPTIDASGPLSDPKYAYYTKDNVFDNNTEPVLSKAAVDARGMSLEELSKFLGAHTGVSSSYVHSGLSGSSVDTFRQLVLQALATPYMFVIVNFDRAQLQEAGAGHHSPIAAYHAASDSVLVLDVSRYKYPAWWATIPQLYAATLGIDASTNKSRGLAFAWATGKASPVLDGIASIPDTDNGHEPATSGQHKATFPTWLVVSLMVILPIAGCILGWSIVTWGHRTAARHALQRSASSKSVEISRQLSRAPSHAAQAV